MCDQPIARGLCRLGDDHLHHEEGVTHDDQGRVVYAFDKELRECVHVWLVLGFSLFL